MKNFRVHIFAMIVFVFAGCATKVDQSKAKTLVENLLNDLKNENYSSLDKYYTSSFNESEPLNQKVEKYKRLKDTMGAIKSFELAGSKENYDSDRGINELELKYKVHCVRMVADESFLVINDEGDEKIIFQNIENSK
jgi:hypothetical protein